MRGKYYLLTDYKGHFGSKYSAVPYRSGFDKEKLRKYFEIHNIDIIFINGSDPNLKLNDLIGKVLLYTSQEDSGLYYKSFIEDFILAAEQSGVVVIPEYRYLHSHENKVFQELLNNFSEERNGIPKSFCFGSLEDYKKNSEKISYPLILKSYRGSGSKQVFLIKSYVEAVRTIKRLNASGNIRFKAKELFRQIIHSGYKRESAFRKKFMVQKYIHGLEYDWKVLIFGDKYFVLKRGIRRGDFKASGQGLLSFPSDIKISLLDYAKQTYLKLDVPFASFDIVCKDQNYFLLESQYIYFGTYTVEFSSCYYCFKNGAWEKNEDKPEVEKMYADSIVSFVKNRRNRS